MAIEIESLFGCNLLIGLSLTQEVEIKELVGHKGHKNESVKPKF